MWMAKKLFDSLLRISWEKEKKTKLTVEITCPSRLSLAVGQFYFLFFETCTQKMCGEAKLLT
jgi:hypothetical protein